MILPEVRVCLVCLDSFTTEEEEAPNTTICQPIATPKPLYPAIPCSLYSVVCTEEYVIEEYV